MNEEKIPPIHPGETLLGEFLEPMGISRARIAKSLSVPESVITDIIQGKKSVTADIALRLGRYFRMSPQFWMGLQNHYDLAIAEDELENRLEQEVELYAA
ncbi:Toxin-antitoxin system, antitoxin component [Desulfonema limicola]|uniref:Toxin-antitoxin system, antitoxin component n=1 Tax=Desulfonema limicola TaxID=45656 RepID=A0A975GEI7_9BACT|nr:HigA family addiction module antitoxin [Desulfonema limicola]QTA78164.1 Toxin-antitoxin system, antitoxin component [Desulfonema limicola]